MRLGAGLVELLDQIPHDEGGVVELDAVQFDERHHALLGAKPDGAVDVLVADTRHAEPGKPTLLRPLHRMGHVTRPPGRWSDVS